MKMRLGWDYSTVEDSSIEASVATFGLWSGVFAVSWDRFEVHGTNMVVLVPGHRLHAWRKLDVEMWRPSCLQLDAAKLRTWTRVSIFSTFLLD